MATSASHHIDAHNAQRLIAVSAAGILAGILAATLGTTTSVVGEPALAARASSDDVGSWVNRGTTSTSFVRQGPPARATLEAANSRTPHATSAVRAAARAGSVTSNAAAPTAPMAAPVASVRETSGGDGTAIAVDPAGAGATVGDTTIGSPPPAPASGVQVTVDPGRGLPPITFVLP